MQTPDPSHEETEETLRPLLFAIAYRMLGSVSESEDLVQETLLRLHTAADNGAEIRSVKAFTATVVTRLAIDQLRSSRVKREEYVGQWLPEPVVTDPRLDPQGHAEMADSLSMAFLVLLESLSPPERAVLLLRDVFGYEFGEIADMIGKSQANTRQIAVRARKAVDLRRLRFEASRTRRWELAERFFAAVGEGDTAGLISMLSSDVMMYGDGGGHIPSRSRPTVTPARVAALLTDLSIQSNKDGLTLTLMEVNAQPGAVITTETGAIHAVMSLDIIDDQVQSIRAVLNPDKLTHLI